MKHIQKHLRKINKETIKKTITALVLLFFAMVMIFQKDAPVATEMNFVRNSDEVFVHNAPDQQREYLFQNESGQQIYQGQIGTGAGIGATETIDNLINADEIAQVLGGTQTGAAYTGTIHTGASQTTGILYTGSLDCITPRKEEVKNKDFVLAYEQRKDVNIICNVEKRVCMSGTLGGTFAQRSCKEDVVYVYTKAPVISYNQKILNEYVQPTAPVNEGSGFTTEGKINETGAATTTRGTGNSPIMNKPEIMQTSPSTKASCTTPRGQIIKHGQFVKAYKAPRGFIDLPCDVQIRACVNGNLKGTYAYAKCTFNNTTYADYLKAGSPTSNTGFLFFQRIKKTFKRGK